ncbi:M56 family metallopeptidase [Streptomyces sp. NPDC052069]|uniref:M56 family metallopeptidase n=1 Tax=Streptomyces sp. NPDC052069 TaxID=3154650 RepID=UPI003433DB81
MGTPARRAQVDERAMGAGTTVRFAMLVAMLLAASGAMMLPVIGYFRTTDRRGCQLAAGIDPDAGGDMASSLNALGQAVPYQACLAKYAPPPPKWEVFGWPVLLAVAAVLLFLLLPAWKARRSRAVPLDAVDKDGAVRTLLADLAETAGLSRLPRVIVDRAAVPTGAVVFGRNRRPTVCLNGGLLACRRSEPEHFRAVLLHEFAHIANRDVTVTYGTVALWRAFLALVLVPYLVWAGTGVLRWSWSTEVPMLIRDLLLPALTVALVYLARSDVLHSREVHADLAALRWGADPHGWDVTAHHPVGGRLRRAAGSLRERWGTHPRWEDRRGVLVDPAPLFGARALPMFLTGAAATVVDIHLLTYLRTYDMYSLWRIQLVSLAPAVLVAGAIGTALWRSVAYAVLTGGLVPSGTRTGLWLGAGMGAGGLLTGYGMGGAEWLPKRPALLLLTVVAGVGFAWWVTQCARLWASTWRGRSLRLPLLTGLVAATMVLSAWFAWWSMDGSAWAAGASFNTDGMRRTLLELAPGSPGAVPGPAVSPDSGAAGSVVLSVVAAVLPVVNGFIATPLIPAAVAALWLMPLAAWALGRATDTPRWVADALPGGDPGHFAGDQVPPLSRTLRSGLLGGAVCCLLLVGVQAYLHTSQPGPAQRGGLYEVRYVTWMLVVLVATAAMTAAVAAVRANRGHRLSGPLIAAESAALLGVAGMVVLVSADGCVEPLNTLQSTCAWHPAWDLLPSMLPRLINGTLALAAILAFLVAAAGSLGRRAWSLRTRSEDRAVEPGAERSRPGGGAGGARRFPVRLVASVCAAGAVVIATVQPLSMAKFHTLVLDPATSQGMAQRWSNVPVMAVSADTRADQVHAWHRLGGRFLLQHATADDNQLRAVLRAAIDTRRTQLADVGPRAQATCADFGRIAGWVNGAYFRIPAPAIQVSWRALGAHAQKGSQDCARALKQKDNALFVTSMRELIAAGRNASTVTSEITAMLHEAGYRGY